MLRLSLLIQATERVTAPVRRIRSAIRGMSRDGERDVGRVGRALDRLRGIAGRAGGAAATALRVRFSAGLSRLSSVAQRAGMAAGRSFARAVGSAIGLGLAGLTAGGGYLLWRLTAGTIETASRFEQFQVVLENTEGSAQRARRAMAWVRDFATTTPYEVEEVMQAFVRLRAYGIDPTDGTLRRLGNAASGMGKSLMDAVEMIADAQTGEFERLKEFGIRASQAGNSVTFAFIRNGRDATMRVRKTASDIRRAITSIFDERFQGMMDRQSRTLAGLWSNLKDMISNFQLSIANAGFFDWVKNKVQELLNRVNRLASDGSLQRWAERISTALESAGEKLWQFATQTDWQAVARDLGAFANALMQVANALGAVGRAINWVRRLETRIDNFWDSAIGGAWYEPLPMRAARRAENQQRARRGAIDQRAREAAPAWNAPAGRVEPRRRAPGELLRRPGLGPAARPAQPAGDLLRRPTAQVGGRVDIRISTDPSSSAQVTRLQSANSNVPLRISRGLVAL